jgi:hypothetical protein
VNIQIIHGAQTGVDRGAHEAALENGWDIAGYMPRDGRDELGDIPIDVAKYLKRCIITGYSARTHANIETAHVVLVVVPDKQNPYTTPGTRLTLQKARALGRPRMVVDPVEDAYTIARWLWLMAAKAQRDPLKVMVAGPRESRWVDGRVETRALLRRVHLVLMEGNEP